MTSNIVHRYFKKEVDDLIILVRVNPIHLRGTEITVGRGRHVEQRELEFDAGIFDDLQTDGFKDASPMEFQLYLSGLA